MESRPSRPYVSPLELLIAFGNVILWFVAGYVLYRRFQQRRYLQTEAGHRTHPQRRQVHADGEEKRLAPVMESADEMAPVAREYETFKASFGGAEP